MFKVLFRHEDNVPFVACAVCELRQGNLLGLSFDVGRGVGLINIPVADRLLNKIRRLPLRETF